MARIHRSGVALVGLALAVGCLGTEDADSIGTTTSALSSTTETAVLNATEDASIKQWLPFASFGNDTTLAVHGAAAGAYERALVQFAGPDISTRLEGKVLVKATLELDIAKCGFTLGTGNVGAYRLTRSWKESTATWACADDRAASSLLSNCDPSNRWTMDLLVPGSHPFASAPTDTQSISFFQTTPIKLDVTKDVTALLNDNAERKVGWMLRNTTELNGVWEDFYSAESARPPRLRLETRKKSPEELIAELRDSSSELVRLRYTQAAPTFNPDAARSPIPLEQALGRGAYALLDTIPLDADLQWNTDLSDAIRKAGYALNGLMAARLPVALGYRPGGRCTNTIFAKNLDDAADRESFISEYFKWVAVDGVEEARAAVAALGGVQEGLRCLNLRDISLFEQAYAGAFYEVMHRLMDGRRTIFARAFWDHSLPLSFLLFDTTKYFQFPAALWVIRFPLDPNAPYPNFSFRTLDRNAKIIIGRNIRDLFPWADTFANAFYCSANLSDREPRFSTIGRFGIWTEDLFNDGALVRLKLQKKGLCKSMRDLTDVVHLGAGDCSLQEMTMTDFVCGSDATCRPIILPNGSIQFRPGSLKTQFGTDRLQVAAADCPVFEQVPPSAITPSIACTEPRRGGGFFSPIPEIDRLLSCAIKFGLQQQTIVRVLSTDQSSPTCRDSWARDGSSGPDAPRNLPNTTGDVTNDPEVEKAAQEAADQLDEDANDLAQAAVAQAGAGNAGPNAASQVAAVLHGTAEALRLGTIKVEFGTLPAVTGGYWVGDCCGTTGTPVITIDRAQLEASGHDLANTLEHEAVHEGLDRATSATSNIFNDEGKHNVQDPAWQEKILKQGGIILCTQDGPCGNDACTHQDSTSRLTDCATKPQGSEPPCPKGSVDVPCRRISPFSGGCVLIDTRKPPVCQTVLCGGSELSVALARDCCTGGGPPPQGGSDPCIGAPKCECCHNCLCPGPNFTDPVVPTEACIGCSISIGGDLPGPD